MSYTKIESDAVTLALIEMTLQQKGANISLAQELLDAGGYVQLDDGSQVWVSCVLHDNPMTPQIDFITVAIALNAEGTTAMFKANGQVVCAVFWHAVLSDTVSVLGVSTVRKALSMIALGEPQPQRAITYDGTPPDGAPLTANVIDIAYTADRCIRTYIAEANELAAPLTDVL